jgi:hypothetical protein
MKIHWKSESIKTIWLLASENRNTKLPNEGVPIDHHPFQFENYKISCAGNFGVHNWKDDGQKLNLVEIVINKLSPKPTKEKEKGKEVVIYQKIVPQETLVNRKGWKVSLSKECMQPNY